jgi:hypothetical protein
MIFLDHVYSGSVEGISVDTAPRDGGLSNGCIEFSISAVLVLYFGDRSSTVVRVLRYSRGPQ